MRHSSLPVRSFVVVVFTFACLCQSPGWGKPVLPASLDISASSEDAGSTITISITASSRIPVIDAEVSILLTEAESDEPTKNILWTGNLDSSSTIARQVYLEDMKPGLHQYTAHFSFTPALEGSRRAGLTRHLYLDIREDRVLSSNVSFRQILRLELKETLSKLGVLVSDLQQKAFQTQYPDLSKQIEELNRETAIQDMSDSDKVKSQAQVLLDARGEPIRTPVPPKPDAKPTTETQN